MAIVDTSRTLPEWAKIALQKIERLTQEAATAERHGNVVTLECVAAMIRQFANPAPPTSGRHSDHCDFLAFSTGNPACTCKPTDPADESGSTINSQSVDSKSTAEPAAQEGDADTRTICEYLDELANDPEPLDALDRRYIAEAAATIRRLTHPAGDLEDAARELCGEPAALILPEYDEDALQKRMAELASEDADFERTWLASTDYFLISKAAARWIWDAARRARGEG